MFKNRGVVNSVDISSLRAPRQNGPYKNEHIEQHNTHKTTSRNKHSEETMFCVFLINTANENHGLYVYLAYIVILFFTPSILRKA